MPLAPIKNILRFSHNKWDKHLISSKKDLSRVPMFVSHNGTLGISPTLLNMHWSHPLTWKSFPKVLTPWTPSKSSSLVHLALIRDSSPWESVVVSLAVFVSADGDGSSSLFVSSPLEAFSKKKQIKHK